MAASRHLARMLGAFRVPVPGPRGPTGPSTTAIASEMRESGGSTAPANAGQADLRFTPRVSRIALLLLLFLVRILSCRCNGARNEFCDGV
jgi:hypothetical protein|eukprot:COSAG03_NODE_122_length_12294_cov_5.013448_5_plen_90_part_00